MVRSILGAILIGLSVLAMVADAQSSEIQQVSVGTEYKEVVSGRYWMMPRSAWLDIKPLKYVQVHWYLEVSDLSLGESVAYDEPVKKRPEWEKLRKEALAKLIDAKLLTERDTSSSHPSELYDELEWRRTVQQALSYRYGKAAKWCKARLVVRTLKDRGSVSGDLRWWNEEIINLSNRCQ